MKITAKVKNIISRKNGVIIFSIKTLEVLAANQVEKRTLKKTVIAKISDNAPIHEKDTIEIIGSFSVGKYGTVLNVSKYSVTKKTQEEQLVSFLIDGSNKQIAKALVEKFGLDTLNKIKDKDEELLQYLSKKPKLATQKLEKLYDYVISKEVWEQLIFILTTLNLAHLTTDIWKEFNTNSINMLKKEPWMLQCLNVRYFKTLHESFNYSKEIQYHTFIILALRNSLKQGHMFLNKRDLQAEIEKYMEDVFDVVLFENLLEELKQHTIVIDEEDDVYFKKIYELEQKCVANLKKRIETKVNGTYINLQVANLDVKQEEAIVMILNNPVSCLTGQPGTGKSFTIIKTIDIIESYGKTYTVLAPTGKASQRIAAQLGQPVSTIHKALKLDVSEDAMSEEIIETDYVIVDESSMLNAFLFNSLMSSISEDTKICFCGDVNQLPSIGVANPFSDLMKCREIPNVELTKIFRQSETSNIVKESHKMLYNKFNPEQAQELIYNTVDFCNINTGDESFQIEYAQIMYENSMKNRGYKREDVTILCSTNAVKDSINQALQEKNETLQKTVINNRLFKLNDKVIQLKNNYEDEVFNGMTGVIVKVSANSILVSFNNEKELEYSAFNIDEIELAYAITTHKAQGSEFPVGIIIVEQSNFNTCNMLYTAVTRCKDIAVLIGDINYINELTKISPVEKHSKLQQKLNTL